MSQIEIVVCDNATVAVAEANLRQKGFNNITKNEYDTCQIVEADMSGGQYSEEVKLGRRDVFVLQASM